MISKLCRINFRLYKEEGKDVFDTRQNVLGQMTVGRKPSPFDRNMGTKMAAKALNWLNQQLESPNVCDKTVDWFTQQNETLQLFWDLETGRTNFNRYKI